MTDFHSYTPAEGHGLRFNPLKAIISPRPIGWISTMGKSGTPNLAPYSFFNLFADTPPLIGFVSSSWKHTATNAVEQGEFVHSVVSAHLAELMVKTAADVSDNESEFKFAGLEEEASDLVAPPRVKGALASLECKTVQHIAMVDLNGQSTGGQLVIGEVVRVHISRSIIQDGLVDTAKLAPISRLGYRDYSALGDLFQMVPPKV